MDYGGIADFTAGDPSGQHLGFGGTIAVASLVVPASTGGGGDVPTGAEGGNAPGGGGGGDVPTGAEGEVGPAGAGGGGGDKGALAFTGFAPAAMGALGAATAAAGVALRKTVRRHK